MISFKYKGVLVQLQYSNDDGHFQYALNQATGKKMMKETYDEDDGYRLVEKTFPVKIMACNVDCVRLIDLDIFVPKFIFIKNTFGKTT